MKKALVGVLVFFVISLFGFQCTFIDKKETQENYWENPVEIDLDEIVKRGYLRAIVDNSSTSYYIYRGRRMGYEFELLKNLANELGVRLHLIIKTDIQEAFYLLNKGKADIIAMNLEITEPRMKLAKFSEPLGQMGTVLVQRKDKNPVKDFWELQDRVIHIRKDAVYKAQLDNIQEAFGINFSIQEGKGDNESFIQKVIKKEIDFTVVDRVEAMVSSTYYDNLDISLEISPKSDVAWAVRKNAPQLEEAINAWIAKKNQSGYINTLYAKYFQDSKNSYFRNNSPFSSVAGNTISPYDNIIKKGAEALGWDWRLLASLVYKESGFDTTATSYAGAVGLLQLMPVTLERFGVENPNDPLESLMGGVNYLKYLDKFWRERIPEANERIKVILASYNIGHGHVEDAWKLALKYGGNPQSWESIAKFLQLKNDPKYFRDPVVKSGYAKGHLAVNYVDDIMILYDSYRVLIDP
ncbi:transporter substrate-binding domain-containing protein [Cecembia calidifontis]|uniref:Membrane-bound lytic murein transglycosylase F n=1 Tax=Cecembia calidifontis TaxID=1187080 RepID=A0A4Q7P7C3_9BACT|nr:transporter substrate-binding domain-containing protein [Cecembia calidifontis]RZS95954.1 membrane-bound lytic murein transglycosylase F [Cecembia calidifontis]